MIKIIQKGIDKVIHSAVGLGSILTVIIAYILMQFDLVGWIWLAPLILASAKELYDLFKHGKPDYDDIFATINPMIVVKWYREQLRK